MTQTYGIAAHPVAHSLSPPMQMAAFRNCGIDAVFLRFDVSPAVLPDFIQRIRKERIAGLSVSLPLKEIIIPYLDEISATARSIGAVNTVFWKGEKLCGENTDAPGFWEAVAATLPAHSNVNAAVIGAGGAARAIIFALKEQGIRLTVLNRTLAKAQALAKEFASDSAELIDFRASDFDLIVNATSVGLKTDISPVETNSWSGFSGVAFDAVFDPLRTRFLRDAESAGATIITGETMLLNQGIRQFEIWTGRQAPKEEMRNVLETVLREK